MSSCSRLSIAIDIIDKTKNPLKSNSFFMIAPVEKVKLHVLGIKRFVLNSIVPQQTISNITRFEGGGGGGGGESTYLSR